ncbi:MAG: hypothetical protein SGARI_000749, partial [Bacillariaceae sp.]
MSEDPPVAAPIVATDAGAATASKSKRKRRKKKKKSKAPVDGGSVAGSDVASTGMTGKQQHVTSSISNDDENNHILTLHERQALMEEGFSPQDILQAVETMWDKNLAYDEYDAVLGFLKYSGDNENSSFEEGYEISLTDGGDKADLSGDQGTVLTVFSEDIGGDVESSTGHSAGDASLTDLEGGSPSPSPSKPVVKLSMAEKLDMVASAENVTDSIFALTQWINKVANKQEVRTTDLITDESCGLEETTDPVMFDNAVLPGLVRLVLLPLKRYGLQLAVVEEGAMEESTEGLLTRTRKAIMMEPADEAGINTELTTKVTEFIVGQISGAIQTAKFSAESSNIHSAAAVSKRRGAESVLVLTSNRNAQKHIAERAGAMARSSVAKLLQNDDGSIATDEDTKSHDLSGMDCGSVPVLVDDAKRTMFEEQRRKVEELKSKIQEGESEKVKWLRSVASGLEAERLTVQEQIAELRMTLQKLESEEEELACKISSTEDDIAQEEMKESAEATLLQDELLNAKEAAKYGTLVGGLSKTMKTYAETVQTAALKKVKMDEASMTAAEVASGNMALYLQELSKYFSAESECLAELKSRLQSHSSKVTSLKLEMEQMSGLGLTTTMGQIEETISS